MATTRIQGGRVNHGRGSAVVVDRAPDQLPGRLLVVIAILWIALPVRALLSGDGKVMPGLGASGAYWALAIGAVLALVALVRLSQRETIVVEGGVVAVTVQDLVRRATWREPLASYHGLRRHRAWQPHRYGQRTWYVIDLWHPDPSKVVELARGRDPERIDDQASTLARRLDLPLLGEDGLAAPPNVATAEPRDRRPAPAA